MSQRASIFLDFKTSGANDVKRVLSGVTSEVRRSAAESRKAADEAKRSALAEKSRIKANETALRRFAQVVSEVAKAKSNAEKKAAADALRSQKQADREATASARAAANAQMAIARNRAREDERWSDKRMQALRREAREQERAAATQARTMAQGVRNARRGAIRTGAALLTTGVVARDELRQFGSTLGVRSREEMVQRSMGFERGLIRLGGQAGLTEEQRNASRARILDTAQRTQVDPNDILQAATMAQNRFSDFSFFEQNQQRFAEASNALDVPMEDIVGAVGEFRRQMGIEAAQIPELIGAMTDAASKGSIEFSDVSAEFASSIGTWSRVTGQTGMTGAREFLAGAEVLGAGGQSGSQSAVLMQNLLAKLASSDVQEAMRARGISTTGADGQFIGLPALVEALANNQRTDSATEMQGVLGRDMQANQAMGILIGQYRQARARGEANPLRTLAQSNADAGNATIDATQAALLDSTAGRARQVGVDAEIAFMRNGDALIQSMTNMAGPLARLENEFPRVAQGLDTLQTALGSIIAMLVAARMLGGGALLAAGVNAGAGTVAAGTAAGATGTAAAAGTGLLPWLATAVGGLAVGAGIGEGFNRLGEVPSLMSVFTGEEDDYMVRAREEEAARQRSRGTVGTYRDIIQRRSSSIGLYGEVEATSMSELLENARRQFDTGDPRSGAMLASVMQKMRDVNADDDMMRTPENRATWERAQAQVDRDAALMREQTAAVQRSQDTNATRIVTALSNLQIAPATGSTTAPTPAPPRR